MASLPKNLKKIAIFRALQLGDILCSIPAIKNLRLAYPTAEITFIGLPSSQKLIERFPGLFNNFIAFPGYIGLPEQEFNQIKYDEFCSVMKQNKFDIIFQMQGNGTIVNKMMQDFGAKIIAGFSINETELNQNPLLLKYPNFGHESSRHLALMEYLEIPSVNKKLEFPLFDYDELAFKQIGLPLTEKYVCIHPGSRGQWRQWPLPFFADIADFCASNGYQIVITGTNEESDLAKQVADLMKYQPIIATGKTDLGTIGVLLKNAKGLIANCTGVSHIADGLQVLSVIISMDGEPNRWGPIDKSNHLTIDWTKQAQYKLVEEAVFKLIVNAKAPLVES
ncbi:glycosyltransferase family 9 protein [Pedobacter mucosus]|uniref:glycosyltransferase family 9 protein n=1 Tax=Pedobacter mucosus TaxID=2895286 RepID=UPI001EE41654|nr:glycosyltransferase family 9 protein [Pedobacter mucosus]UKT62594.1 glycosyltransferase family 9 protein [Pedobacter mucosus]